MMQLSTAVAHISYSADKSLLHVTIKNDALMNLSNLKDHYSKIHQLTRGKRHLALIDVTAPYFIDEGGFEYAASKIAIDTRIAAAYYNPQLANRLNLMNLQRRIENRIPTFIAMEKTIAERWLSLIKS